MLLEALVPGGNTLTPAAAPAPNRGCC